MDNEVNPIDDVLSGADAGQSGDQDPFGRGAPGTTLSSADPPPGSGSSGLGGTASGEAEGDGGGAAAPPPADPNIAASRAQPTQQNQWTSVTDTLRRLGFEAPEGSDDLTVLSQLAQQAQRARQVDYYAQLGRQLAPHAPKIQQYLQAQREPEPEPSEWDRPEFDERWLGLVDRDPKTGLFVGKPGAPPQIVEQANQYMRWLDRTQREPDNYIAHVVQSKVLKPFLERLERIEQGFQSQTQQGEVERILQANSSWLYQRDDSGQVRADHKGNPVLSPAGARYAYHVQNAKQMGIAATRDQDHYARSMVQAEILQQQSGAGGRQQAQQANPQTRAAGAPRPNRNALGTLPASSRAVNPAATERTSDGLSLAQMLSEAFQAEGITDADFDLDRMFQGS